jgi:hypothetical protein
MKTTKKAKTLTADQAWTKTMMRVPKETLVRVIKENQEKAAKYDDLQSKIDKCYEMDGEGELIDKDSDLCSIGEIVCHHFGYL